MHRMNRLLLFAVLVLFTTGLFANNIRVTNVTLTGQDAAANTSVIQFDLAWDNSWRISSGPANWDAAWVFAKYRVGGGPWTHAILTQGTTTQGDATVRVPSDQIGAMIYRATDGTGAADFNGLELTWRYGSVNDDAVVDIQVFAIEMVYVPEGAFTLGTGRFTGGNQEDNEFRRGLTSSAYTVTSEAAITIGTASTNLYYYADNGGGGDQTGSLSTSYPKGFGAFYSMKYEISEGQWVAFFNTLADGQKDNNDITGPGGKNTDNTSSRNTISWTSGNATTSAPDRALNWLSGAQLAAYLDWSGLRPMSELEYEKACRGPVNPTNGEYAWGTADIYATTFNLLSSGTSNERVSNPGTNIGNASYSATDGTINGPLRVGALAASFSAGSRQETGGSYYGIMELSGNVYERCVTVGTFRGRQFTGLHGNGIISNQGFGTVSNWPNDSTGDGWSFRGGSFTNSSDFLKVSDRFDAASIIPDGNERLGGRGVRTDF